MYTYMDVESNLGGVFTNSNHREIIKELKSK